MKRRTVASRITFVKATRKERPAIAGELRDLDQDQLAVQRRPQRVPAPAGKDHAAEPFLRDPGGREKKGEPEIIYRAEPGRTTQRFIAVAVPLCRRVFWIGAFAATERRGYSGGLLHGVFFV